MVPKLARKGSKMAPRAKMAHGSAKKVLFSQIRIFQKNAVHHYGEIFENRQKWPVPGPHRGIANSKGKIVILALFRFETHFGPFWGPKWGQIHQISK